MRRKVRLTKKGLPDKRVNNGRHPNSHKVFNGGRPRSYTELLDTTIAFRTSTRLAQRLEFEIERQGKGRNRLFNEWLETLPPSPIEKTAEMQERYELSKELKKAGL